MVDKDLIVLNMEAETANEVITHLGNLMLAKEYVKDTYIGAVLDREKKLPTGLEIGDFNVAIPHTDSNHVKQSNIAIATLKNPVNFCLMVNPQEQIKTELVFLLAVKNPNAQVELLRSIMSVFQNKELLRKLRNTELKEEAAALLNCLAV